MNKNFSLPIMTFLRKTVLRRGSMFGMILMVALLAFEVFNYSTTDFALTDLLGKDLTFMGLRWATILSIAFCGIDFAGIARLFTPEQGRDEPAEVWYLFGAWILAAAMNASLTWWGVAIAVGSHTPLGSSIIGQDTMSKVIPVFVAVMVWIIRLLLIGTFAMSGERLFSMVDKRAGSYEKPVSRLNQLPARPTLNTPVSQRPATTTTTVSRPAVANPSRPVRSEPSYHPVGMAAKSSNEDTSTRR